MTGLINFPHRPEFELVRADVTFGAETHPGGRKPGATLRGAIDCAQMLRQIARLQEKDETFAVLLLPCTVCGSVQTLCYHYCARLWPHPHSGEAWEKTRSMIVADHPPDTMRSWDSASWAPCWASTCSIKEVKAALLFIGECLGFSLICVCVYIYLIHVCIHIYIHTFIFTHTHMYIYITYHHFWRAQHWVLVVLLIQTRFFIQLRLLSWLHICFRGCGWFGPLSLTVVCMFCILARWLSIAINYHVKAHVATRLHNKKHKGLTSRVPHYAYFQVFSSYPQIWGSSPAPPIILKTLSRPPEKLGERLNFSLLRTSPRALLDHPQCLEGGKHPGRP